MSIQEAPHGEVSTADVEDVLQPIPESKRTTRVSGQFWIWAGANVAPINWILGALGVELGLSLRDTLIVLVLGNLLGMAGFGFFVLLGQRSGATGMLLSRGAFGRRGAYLPAAVQAVVAIGWSAVNTWIILDLVMSLFGILGWVDPNAHNYAARIAVAAVIMIIQVTICFLGYRAIAAFERWSVPPTVLVLVVMSVLAWTTVNIKWGYQGEPGHILTGMPRLAAMSGVMTAIGIGWGIGWFTYAPDYSRFVSKSVPRRRLYLVSVLGQFLPVIWLGVLGASLATTNSKADPGQLIAGNFGAMAIPIILLVIHGPIATNIINMYTFSVASQALDIRISRKALSLLVGVLSMCAVIGFMFTSDFASVVDTWLSAIAGWVATWAGIMIVHYFVFERHHRDYDYLFRSPQDTQLKAVNPWALIAFAGGLVMTWMFMYGGTPILQGPIARATNGIDLSWLAGGLTSGLIYFVAGYPRFRARIHAGVPLGIRAGLDDETASRELVTPGGTSSPEAAVAP
ncbi:cytosine permease [Allobranchiibius sp. CTAmp26]|uniref:purine-cytosine permease family protein n=1 Tax=Allobranchiibius sp. CTAmp26 TaxID=2815214 RepID=UPI001AA19371|nr:cytosine permease [Allobranchiibius sp. CTAmp26]MBO1754560.1 cytosine permease [Allobranchiibius sp. CTAmp26]